MQIHRAPEQTDDEFGARGPYTDVWGFATTILHLATGQQPYKDLALVQMVTAMTKGRGPAVPDTLPVWLQHTLKSCFSFEVTKRPTVLQLLQVKPLSVRLIASCASVQFAAVMTFFMQLASRASIYNLSMQSAHLMTSMTLCISASLCKRKMVQIELSLVSELIAIFGGNAEAGLNTCTDRHVLWTKCKMALNRRRCCCVGHQSTALTSMISGPVGKANQHGQCKSRQISTRKLA